MLSAFIQEPNLWAHFYIRQKENQKLSFSEYLKLDKSLGNSAASFLILAMGFHIITLMRREENKI